MKIQRPFWMWPQRAPQIRDAAEGRVFVDAAAGRKHLKQQRVRNKLSAASRAEETETRHDEWRADMEATAGRT